MNIYSYPETVNKKEHRKGNYLETRVKVEQGCQRDLFSSAHQSKPTIQYVTVLRLQDSLCGKV